MTYKLVFDPRAYSEWKKLGSTVREQFKKKLANVAKNPRIPSVELRELTAMRPGGSNVGKQT